MENALTRAFFFLYNELVGFSAKLNQVEIVIPARAVVWSF